MIQKIIDMISNDISGSYTDIIEAEKILKLFLTFAIIDKVFQIDPKDDGVVLKQDASKFANLVKEQLDLYVEDNQVQLFIFSTIMVNYFLDSKRIINEEAFGILIINQNEQLFGMIRDKMKPELVEELRNVELFFKGVGNEKV